MLSYLAFRLAALGLRVAVVTSRSFLYDNPLASFPPLEHFDGVEILGWPGERGRSGNLLAGPSTTLDFHVAAFSLAELIVRGDVVVAKDRPR